MNNKGLTILEIIIAVAIILTSSIVGVGFLLQNKRISEIREIGNKIAADIFSIRNDAIRYNVKTELKLLSDFSGYTLMGRPLPEGSENPKIIFDEKYEIGFANNNTDSPIVKNIAYTAPNGELASAVNFSLRIRAKDNSVSPLYIKIVGVTGKVIKSERESN